MTALLIIHILSGAIALLVAPVAIATKKYLTLHRSSGKIYFWAMTAVFITAVILSSIKFIPFLLMIASFSYYSVFSGYRWKYLKQVHRDKSVLKWYDWAALIINTIWNTAFILWGITKAIDQNTFGFLAVFFGIIALNICYNHYRHFTEYRASSLWLGEHIGGMLGGYIGTVTAFSVQMFHFMPDWLQWTWPSLIGTPLLIYLTRNADKKRVAV